MKKVVTDVIVVGAGAAGLTVALGLPACKVSVLTKTALQAGAGSWWAQGGIAAAMGADDSPQLHAQDTLAVAGGLAHASMVNILTRAAPKRICRLLDSGVQFDRNQQGQLLLGREAAHSCDRILHVGDATGAELMRVLINNINQADNVTVVEHCCAIDLIATDGRISGVLTCDQQGHYCLFMAKAIVLASGGIGQLYACTTNPAAANGDGLAMAARAGALLADLAFMQFHPTALAVGADPMPLLTEALRGAGAALVDDQGARFMLDVHPQAELAPRDLVARVIWQRLRQGKTCFLDCRTIANAGFQHRFPLVDKNCRQYGIDPVSELIPVAPAAHYHMGGVWVNEYGRSSLPGLWACGEVAATGVHGANRLASNSLLESLVFGDRVAKNIAHAIQSTAVITTVPDGLCTSDRKYSFACSTADQQLIALLRKAMWDCVGIERCDHDLQAAIALFDDYKKQDNNLVVRNFLTVACLIAQAALMRQESRGGHYRRDYPQPDPLWQKRLFINMSSSGMINYNVSRQCA